MLASCWGSGNCNTLAGKYVYAERCRETSLPIVGSAYLKYDMYNARNGCHCGVVNSRMTNFPPGFSTRASSRMPSVTEARFRTPKPTTAPLNSASRKGKRHAFTHCAKPHTLPLAILVVD